MEEYQFGERSREKLSQLEGSLRAVLELALSWGIMDFAVIEGHRGKAEQNRLHSVGLSRVEWPDGMHNSTPSMAADVVPWVNGAASWKAVHCVALSGVVLAAGAVLGVRIRWGGNWDMDGEPMTDQDFQDLVHYEKI